MKKKGFTLAELLVAISIVGIVAAITIPAINKIVPDKDKGTALKVYKIINEINAEIFNDPSLYMFEDDPSNPSCKAPYILRCVKRPLDDRYFGNSEYSDYNKYTKLLLTHLTLADANVDIKNGKCTFTTSDGTSWTIDMEELKNTEDKFGIPNFYTIQINTNRSSRQNCLYSSECTNPRLFKFVVNSKGEVKASDDDYLTQAFLLTSDEPNNRSADLRKAAALAGEASSGSSS